MRVGRYPHDLGCDDRAGSHAVLLLIVIVAWLCRSPATALSRRRRAHTLLVLGGSILVGIALGLAAVSTSVRYGSADVVLVILAFIARRRAAARPGPVLFALAAAAHCETPLRSTASGCAPSSKRCAIPIYVVFFALAGSNLQLDVLAEMWPWALLLAGLRVAGLWAGCAGRRESSNRR